MTQHTIDPITEKRLVEVLLEIPQVRFVVPEAGYGRVFLICDADAPEREVLTAAREALREAQVEAGGLDIIISYTAVERPARRARFMTVDVERPDIGSARATVVLEWQGECHEGTAEGEATAAGEMRICAHATIRALEHVIGGATRFNLVGIKAIRIFDTDFVTVLLHSDSGERGLIGASLVSETMHRAAALAVLNATNRVLGNFLMTP